MPEGRACIKLSPMRFISSFIVGLGCLMASGVAQAQPVAAQTEPLATEAAPTETAQTEPRYRVELLIFRHLAGTEEGFIETELRDFSDALDLLTPPETVAEGDAPPKTVEPSKPHATETSPDVAAEVMGEGEAEETMEPAVELVEQQSEAMQHAWRRLRASAGFRPEQFMAWEQSMAEPVPYIRVHDLEVLKELDPLTGQKLGEMEDAGASGEPVEYNDTTKRPYETATDGDAAAMPQPIRFYRIDGSSRLRRSRFLHLELDIEFREPGSSQPPAVPVPAPASDYPADRGSPAQTAEPAWTVHRLSQSRQVQNGKYEYFDGPRFAVLALVTRIDELSTEEELAEEALATEAQEVQP